MKTKWKSIKNADKIFSYISSLLLCKKFHYFEHTSSERVLIFGPRKHKYIKSTLIYTHTLLHVYV